MSHFRQPIAARPIVIDGLGSAALPCGERMVRVHALSPRRIEVEDLHTGGFVFLARENFRAVTPEEQAWWVCADLDNTLLEPPEDTGEEPPFLGEAREGAAEFCQSLQDMGCRVSGYSARFYFLDTDSERDAEIARITAHLAQQGVPVDDVYVGLKPPAHAFVDDRGVSVLDLGFPEVLEQVQRMVHQARLFNRSGMLGIDQAIEKAKTMTSHNHLSQESYALIEQQLDEADRYPFAMALVEKGILVRTGTAGRRGRVNVVDAPETTDAVHDMPWGVAFPAGADGESTGLADETAPDRHIEGEMFHTLTELDDDAIEETEHAAVSTENLVNTGDRVRDPSEGKIAVTLGEVLR